MFDLTNCENWLSQHNFKRIALQIDAKFVTFAIDLCKALERPGRAVFVLGDSSYSACCVDEVAALHNQADCIVHIGDSCLSKPSRIPAYLIFGKEQLTLSEEACRLIANKVNEEESLVTLILYSPQLDSTSATRLKNTILLLNNNNNNRRIYLTKEIPKFLFPTTSATTTSTSKVLGFEMSPLHDGMPPLNINTMEEAARSNIRLFYVGDLEYFPLSQLQLQFSNIQVFDLASNLFQSYRPNVSKTLAKRYHFIEKARDASIFGIIVGTTTVAGYLSALENVRGVIKNANRKSYTFLVGKLNPAKLANFTEIDIFVMLACAQSTLIDSKDFHKPIITPFELCVAFNSEAWSGEASYKLDFSALSFEAKKQIASDGDDDLAPRHSLASGGVLIEKALPNSIVLKYSSPYADALALKPFRGVEKVSGEQVAPMIAKQGLSGIAMKYSTEEGGG